MPHDDRCAACSNASNSRPLCSGAEVQFCKTSRLPVMYKNAMLILSDMPTFTRLKIRCLWITSSPELKRQAVTAAAGVLLKEVEKAVILPLPHLPLLRRP